MIGVRPPIATYVTYYHFVLPLGRDELLELGLHNDYHISPYSQRR